MTNTSGLATGETKSTKKDRALLLGAAPLIAVVAVVVVAILAGWALVANHWVSSTSDYVKLVGRGGFTGLGGLAIAVLLHYRWMIDREDQKTQEDKRRDAEQRRHREQERGKRQEKMGDRMAQAISHLGEGRGFMQVSGLIELAGLVDDWWSLGQEMLADIPDADTYDAERERERERVREMIRQRRQEIIDLMFKHTLSPDGVNGSSNGSKNTAEDQRRKMVQEARAQSLTSHLHIREDGKVSDESWAKLDLSLAYLKGAETDLSSAQLLEANLERAYLGGAKLDRAKLDRANLNRADLNGANLNGADLNDAELIDAYLNGAELNGAELNVAYLNDAYLIDAKLNGADLRGADLSGADLRVAHLRGADLRGADLSEADLSGADLRRATLDDHYDGSPTYDKNTKFPEGYDPEAAGFKLEDDD